MNNETLDDNVVPLQKKDKDEAPSPLSSWEEDAKRRKEKEELERKKKNETVKRDYRLKT
jgi:hypothetical protein